MKKAFFGMVMAGGIVMWGAQAYAQDHGTHDQMMQMPVDDQKQADPGAFEKATNVGNAICPVSGEKVGQGMEPATYEYKGKIYNFCCAMCIDEFKNDPEKYIKKIDDELKAKAGKQAGQ